MYIRKHKCGIFHIVYVPMHACMHTMYAYIIMLQLYGSTTIHFLHMKDDKKRTERKKKPLARYRRSLVGKPVCRNTWGIVCCDTLLILYIFNSCFFIFYFYYFILRSLIFLPFTFVDR